MYLASQKVGWPARAYLVLSLIKLGRGHLISRNTQNYN